MKGVILLNGEPYKGKIDFDNAVVVCADGALKWANDAGIKPTVCVGDFDSLGYVPDGGFVFPVEKDYTDGEIALKYLVDKGIKDIEIYGGAGRRDDHYFGNIGLLSQAYNLGVKAVFCTDYTRFYIVTGNVQINEKKDTTVSLMPLTEVAHIVNGCGFKYSLENIILRAGESRGLSNIIIDNSASFTVKEGKCLLFEVIAD